MIMNKNTIEFNDFNLDIPKINETQYTLLRNVLIAIEKDININKTYFISLSIFKNIAYSEIISLLKANIKISITDKKTERWYGSDAISDIEIIEDKILFRPASILRDIILDSKKSAKHSYLKYILFNGIRYKQTLLFIDYMLSQKVNSFTIEVSELKEVLELKPTQYKNFNALNASVINRIVTDINTKTTYYISYETSKKRNGKKIISLTFDFYNKELTNV